MEGLSQASNPSCRVGWMQKALWAEAMAWAKAGRCEDGPGRELQVLPHQGSPCGL